MHTRVHEHVHTHTKHHWGACLPISCPTHSMHSPIDSTAPGGILRCRIWPHPAPREKGSTERASEAEKENPSPKQQAQVAIKRAKPCTEDSWCMKRKCVLYPFYRTEGECSEKLSVRIPAHHRLQPRQVWETLAIYSLRSVQDKHLPQALSLRLGIYIPRERYRWGSKGWRKSWGKVWGLPHIQWNAGVSICEVLRTLLLPTHRLHTPI